MQKQIQRRMRPKRVEGAIQIFLMPLAPGKLFVSAETIDFRNKRHEKIACDVVSDSEEAYRLIRNAVVLAPTLDKRRS
jgi:hypothetical protein